MFTTVEYCIRHGHQDFFLDCVFDPATDEYLGEALHCPVCEPERFADRLEQEPKFKRGDRVEIDGSGVFGEIVGEGNILYNGKKHIDVYIVQVTDFFVINPGAGPGVPLYGNLVPCEESKLAKIEV